MIIGLAGTLSSGKDTLAHYLENEFGFMHVSTGDLLREMKQEKFGDSLLHRGDDFANKLRNEQGPGVLVKLAYQRYLANKKDYPGGLVVSGIRSIGEAEYIKQLGGTIFFVDADIQVRFKRAESRARDKNDALSFDAFVEQEKIEKPSDPNDVFIQNLVAMREMADVILDNSGELEVFIEQAEKVLRLQT